MPTTGLGTQQGLAEAFRAAQAKTIVSARFQRLIGWTDFSPADHFKYATHRSTAVSRLTKAFVTNGHKLIGSAKRGSAISQGSDIDIMLILKTSQVKRGDSWVSSDTVLNNIRLELQDRYPNTPVGRDEQAVVIEFGGGQYPVDVIPAVFGSFGTTVPRPLYLIPDGIGGWRSTSPDTHDTFIMKANLQSGGKLKNLAKLVKYWKWCRTPELPLRSFHVETLIASQGICIGAKKYSECLAALFEVLRDRQCRALHDPCKISGFISAASTEVKRDRLYHAVVHSQAHADEALAAERRGDHTEAVRQWNIVFNGHFPAA